MKTYIYILQDPITQEVRYVGKSNNPKRRYTSHLCDKPKVKYYSYYWIQSLLKKGLKPIMTIIDETDHDWQQLEKYWIGQFKAWGFKLTNITEGGEGQRGVKFSKETRQKMSDSRKGFKPKPESILKMKETIKNRVITDEWRKNMSKSANNKGSNNGNTKLTEDVVIEIKKDY